MKSKFKSLFLKRKSFNLKQQEQLLLTLAILLKRGYSIKQSLDFLSFETEFQNLRLNLEEGKELVKSLELLKIDSDALLIIEISQMSGQMSEGFIKASQFLKAKEEMKKSIIEKFRYPIVLSIMFLAMITVMSNYVLPQFEQIYESLEVVTPIYFKVFLLSLKVLPNLILFLVISFLITMLWFKKLSKEKQVSLILKIKWLKKPYLKLYEQIFLINITELLKLNLRHSDIFEILSNQNYNYLLKKESKFIKSQLEKGKMIEQILNSEIYSKQLRRVIKTGSQSGLFYEALESYKQMTKMRLINRTSNIIQIIQPISYLIFGLIIVILYAMIFMPIFSIMETI